MNVILDATGKRTMGERRAEITLALRLLELLLNGISEEKFDRLVLDLSSNCSEEELRHMARRALDLGTALAPDMFAE